MSESEDVENPDLFKDKVGQRLKAAREHAGLSLSDIAGQTRITLRHLVAIEASDHSHIPSPTYSIGFVKSYARTLGLDEAEFAHDIRIELGQLPSRNSWQNLDYEPVDPIRVAPKWLAWSAALLAVLFFGGYLLWRHSVSVDSLPPAAQEAPIAGAVDNAPLATSLAANASSATSALQNSVSQNNSASPAAQPTASGAVVLTASKPVWIRIYDAKDKVLLEKEMGAGETYTVPADADHPQIRTGAANLINVSVNGKAVPQLGSGQHMIKDVGISAAELMGRSSHQASPHNSSQNSH